MEKKKLYKYWPVLHRKTIGIEIQKEKTKKARLHLQVPSSARGFSWGDVLAETLEGAVGARVCMFCSNGRIHVTMPRFTCSGFELVFTKFWNK